MDSRARNLAVQAAGVKGLAANAGGMFNVRHFATRVTNRLEAKVVVSGLSANGLESEETVNFEYVGDGIYSPL